MRASLNSRARAAGPTPLTPTSRPSAPRWNSSRAVGADVALDRAAAPARGGPRSARSARTGRTRTRAARRRPQPAPSMLRAASGTLRVGVLPGFEPEPSPAPAASGKAQTSPAAKMSGSLVAQGRVDHDAAVDGEPGRLGELGPRHGADADQHEVGLERAAVGQAAAATAVGRRLDLARRRRRAWIVTPAASCRACRTPPRVAADGAAQQLRRQLDHGRPAAERRRRSPPPRAR